MEQEKDRKTELVYMAIAYYHQMLLNDVGYLGEEDYEEIMVDVELLEEIIGEMQRKYNWIQNS